MAPGYSLSLANTPLPLCAPDTHNIVICARAHTPYPVLPTHIYSVIHAIPKAHCMHTYVHTHVHTQRHESTQASSQVVMYGDTHTHAHTHYTHTCMHTHTPHTHASHTHTSHTHASPHTPWLDCSSGSQWLPGALWHLSCCLR